MNKSEQLNERIMEALRQKAKEDAAAIVEALFPKRRKR